MLPASKSYTGNVLTPLTLHFESRNKQQSIHLKNFVFNRLQTKAFFYSVQHQLSSNEIINVTNNIPCTYEHRKLNESSHFDDKVTKRVCHECCKHKQTSRVMKFEVTLRKIYFKYNQGEV